MKKLNLNENFISRIWENPSYYNMLNTTKRESVEVISYGTKNTGSGADYSGAKIKIGGILYIGDVEIHRSEKDWHLHKHQKDGKYNKVILQIVLWKTDENSGSAESKFAREIPTVILSEFLQKSIHLIWKEIINNPSPEFRLPCYKKNSIVSAEEKKIYLDKLGVKRLKQKALRIEQAYFPSGENIKKRSNWDIALYTFLAEGLGYSKNKEQFLKLAGKINPEKVKSLNLKLIQTDALLFNTAGFLNEIEPIDDYGRELLFHREKLSGSIDSVNMDFADWNFFPLRPPNFPTLRIAYLSGILIEILYNDFFKRLFFCFENSKAPQKDLITIFRAVPVSDYWQTHYNFGKIKKSGFEVIGESRINDIIINTLLPLFLLYARKFEKKELITKISDYFLSTKEKSGNEVTKAMSGQLDYKLKTISENQGAIQLHNFYCTSGKCDDCYIGTRVFTEPHVSDYLQIILY